MNTAVRLVTAGVLLSAILQCLAPPNAVGGYSTPLSPFDEIMGRQSLGYEATLFGDHAFMDVGRHSIAVHPFLALYGEDGMGGGLTASYHRRLSEMWGLGFGVAVSDIDFGTGAAGVNATRYLMERGRSSLIVQGSYVYQRLFEGSGSETALYLDFTEDFSSASEPLQDLVLLDTFTANSLVIHAVYRYSLPIIQPILDVGWAGTYWSLDGAECGPTCFEAGPGRSESGTAGNVSFGLGASLTLGQAIAFAGIKGSSNAALFLATMGVRF